MAVLFCDIVRYDYSDPSNFPRRKPVFVLATKRYAPCPPEVRFRPDEASNGLSKVSTARVSVCGIWRRRVVQSNWERRLRLCLHQNQEPRSRFQQKCDYGDFFSLFSATVSSSCSSLRSIIISFAEGLIQPYSPRILGQWGSNGIFVENQRAVADLQKRARARVERRFLALRRRERSSLLGPQTKWEEPYWVHRSDARYSLVSLHNENSRRLISQFYWHQFFLAFVGAMDCRVVTMATPFWAHRNLRCFFPTEVPFQKAWRRFPCCTFVLGKLDIVVVVQNRKLLKFRLVWGTRRARWSKTADLVLIR